MSEAEGILSPYKDRVVGAVLHVVSSLFVIATVSFMGYIGGIASIPGQVRSTNEEVRTIGKRLETLQELTQRIANNDAKQDAKIEVLDMRFRELQEDVRAFRR